MGNPYIHEYYRRKHIHSDEEQSLLFCFLFREYETIFKFAGSCLSCWREMWDIIYISLYRFENALDDQQCRKCRFPIIWRSWSLYVTNKILFHIVII